MQWDDSTKTAVVQRGEKTIDIASHPFFEIGGNNFVYDGEMQNGLPNGEGTGVRGLSLYGEVLHQAYVVAHVLASAAILVKEEICHEMRFFCHETNIFATK